MSLTRRLPRAAHRTVILRTVARPLSTSATLYALRSTKQSGPRNLRQSRPSAWQPLKNTSASRAAGVPRSTKPEISANQSNQQPETSADQSQQQPEQTENAPSRVEAVSAALREGATAGDNSLLAPVNIPDDPHGILKPDHPAASILANSTIVVQRQLEMMNVFLGFEQANRYVLMDGQGNQTGYLAEQENGLGGTMARQMFKTHRSFTTHVFDNNEREVLRIHRPFSWISSKIRVYDCINDTHHQHASADALKGSDVTSLVAQTSPHISPLPLSTMPVIGEAQQQWAPLRRKYNLFLARDPSTFLPNSDPDNSLLTSGDLSLPRSSKAIQPVPDAAGGNGNDQTFVQFAHVDEPWLSWDFTLKPDDPSHPPLGSVNRNFGGFAREIFTDTGVYALRMDSLAATSALAAPQDPQQQISSPGAAQHIQQAGGFVAVEPQQQEPTAPGMTLDQRASTLATAVSIDFDYFSRHSTTGTGFFGMPIPIWLPGMGGGAAAEGAAAEGAIAGGAAEAGAAGRAVGAVEAEEAARGVTGAAAGAGTMVGYEAMQRGRGGAGADDASPVASNDPWTDGAQTPGQQGGQDVWGEQDPWGGWGDKGGGGGGGGPPASGGGGGGGDGGGDGGGFDFSDFF